MNDFNADGAEKQNQKNIIDQKMKIDSRRQFPVYEIIVGIGIDVGPGQGGNNADNERDRQLPDFLTSSFIFVLSL